MNEERLNVVPVTSSARNTPEVESSADADHRHRRREAAEFEEQHGEDQHHGKHQHNYEIAKRALLLLVLAAVCTRIEGGRWSSASGFLHGRDSAPQIATLQARGYA